MLNALRHQRLGNDAKQAIQNAPAKCSTPCGINGWETLEMEGDGPKFQVLNALRHQRLGNDEKEDVRAAVASVLNALRHQRLGNSPMPEPIIVTSETCSTPCGINGWETLQILRLSFCYW